MEAVMLNGSANYGSAVAFRQALEARLKAEAASRGRSREHLRREFLFQRFLALVFANDDQRWVLKGGASLLMRLADARFSRDLDLQHREEISAEQAVEELRALTKPHVDDHLTFVLEDGIKPSSSNHVVKVAVTAYIGARYSSFPIDLAHGLHLVAAPERIRPTPVVDTLGLAELPEITVYPLTDQVADKVCAMYELHGQLAQPSSRYRDLVDLALIISTCELDAAGITRALGSESTRRSLQLPTALTSPAPNWAAGYRGTARDTPLDPELHDLERALAYVGHCLNPLLDGSRTQGRWTHPTGWT